MDISSMLEVQVQVKEDADVKENGEETTVLAPYLISMHDAPSSNPTLLISSRETREGSDIQRDQHVCPANLSRGEQFLQAYVRQRLFIFFSFFFLYKQKYFNL